MHLPNPYRPEAGIVAERLNTLSNTLDWGRAAKVAAPWVMAVRDQPPPFWAMETLLKEYPISSAEGLALMRLAEALLRVPDAETAIALTADQLGRADFDGAQDSALTRLSSAAIALSKKFLPTTEDAKTETSNILTKLGAKTVVAATLRAVQLLGHQFVLGQNIEEAMKVADASRKKTANLRFSYDMLGEGARTNKDALHYLESYKNAIMSIATKSIAQQAYNTAYTAENSSKIPLTALNDGISIKLSALHPRYEDAQRSHVMAELVSRVWSLCELAAKATMNLTIDAEEVDRLELSLDVFEALIAKVATDYPQWAGFGLAMQAYQTRAQELVEHITHLARRYNIKLMCRLVKGAYWDSEIKRAQELGMPHYPVFTHKHHTDVSYLACAKALLDAPDAVYPQFATHNAATIAAILQMSAKTGAPFELQRLHGMGEGIYREVLKNPLIACRVYAPVGAHRDLLAYLVRRLLENGANSSFVHQLTDESVGMNELLISPLRLEPRSAFALPPKLFGEHASARQNSTGVDLTVETMRAPLFAAHQTTAIPVVPEYAVEAIPEALKTSLSSYKIWCKTAVSERATILRIAADNLDHQMPMFCALLVKEAFKTWGDAVSEVREAVDFLRYYADEAERIMAPRHLPGPTGETNELRLIARGPWVCISPWNFPLAIFTGQVAAALATGNSVLAKPAEQTPAVAMAMVALMHQAGVPCGVLQLLHGSGETVGAALVAASGVAGVVFTGSTQVAKIINRTLAAKDGPIVPLIAETGGINAMLVDSTALPEQVVDAVIQGAFRSAGQRCSALRLLCVHDSIADGVIEMIRGAAAELRVGDTVHLETDLGRVIDLEAGLNIKKHLQRLNTEAKSLLDDVFIDDIATNNIANIIPPQAFEIKSIGDIGAEIFGPVLHVLRWRGDPSVVIAQINALGYGLTLGIQTRIDSRAQALARAAHVGNVYVNRNQIGAVVGVQPFGGEGLSGTGPKAGGPHYLYRFCAEQTITINTTAAGGNAALLAA
jgi:RHH-type transcriptional regulator, proline utilization regulon repressor / proline dehydrogenase / delta 1-pyrroline-5-carboxylate dehydrogenase